MVKLNHLSTDIFTYHHESPDPKILYPRLPPPISGKMNAIAQRYHSPSHSPITVYHSITPTSIVVLQIGRIAVLDGRVTLHTMSLAQRLTFGSTIDIGDKGSRGIWKDCMRRLFWERGDCFGNECNEVFVCVRIDFCYTKSIYHHVTTFLFVVLDFMCISSSYVFLCVVYVFFILARQKTTVSLPANASISLSQAGFMDLQWPHHGAKNLMKTDFPAVCSSQLSGVRRVAVV